MAEEVDVIYRMVEQGSEKLVRVVGDGGKQLALTLFALIKEELKQTGGSIDAKKLVKEGGTIHAVPIPDDRLDEFTEMAKKYHVMFATVDHKEDSSYEDLLFAEESAPRVNRIFEELNIGTLPESKVEIKSDFTEDIEAAENISSQVQSSLDKASKLSAKKASSRPLAEGSSKNAPEKSLESLQEQTKLKVDAIKRETARSEEGTPGTSTTATTTTPARMRKMSKKGIIEQTQDIADKRKEDAAAAVQKKQKNIEKPAEHKPPQKKKTANEAKDKTAQSKKVR
jgi:hypothetical protein